MTNLTDEDVIVPTNTHLSPECNTVKFELTEKYKFIKKGFFFNLLSIIVYTFACIVFFPITSIAYGLKVKGRKNLKGVKNAIFISNHVYILDMLAIHSHILATRRPYLLANHRPFHMPFVRRLMRLLRAVPLPDTPTTTRNFLRDVDNAVASGASLLVFPEGSMWDYYPKVRPFMSGAFRFSIKNNVPVVPLVATYRKPNWFYRMFGRKKPLITINILPPITPSDQGTPKQREQELEERAYHIMSEFFKENSTYNTYISKPVSKILKNKKSQS